LSYRNKENSLDKLGLLSKGQLLNTAVILFANNPEKYFPNAKLRCAVFGRTDTAYIVDRQEYTGDIFYLINSAETYILEHIDIGMRLDGLVRVDVPEIDRDAFREAIINAFCHRDYFEYDSVNIAIFKDRLEIRNPGRLYGGLTIKQIRTRMVSQRRNELIADIFHRGRFVERWGRGISLILSKEPTAKFEEIGESFYVTFKRKNYESQMPHKTKLPEKLSENLSELQRIIMTNMRQKPKIIYAQLVNITGKSREAIRKNINLLKKAGLVKRIGPDKGGHWQITTD
jgi:ATP-dependent DNA helicase RecG